MLCMIMKCPLNSNLAQAAQDELLSLSSPVISKSGEELQSITIPKGTTINIPLRSITCRTHSGDQMQKTFVPERWLNNEKDVPKRAKEIQGYHHTLTFMDGPRMCLGRNIAVAEMKVSRIATYSNSRTNLVSYTISDRAFSAHS